MQDNESRRAAPGRRALLAGIAASPLALHALKAQAAVAGGSADAALIAACAELLRIDGEILRIELPLGRLHFDDPRYHHPETGFAATRARVDDLIEGYDELVGFVCATRARTLAGLAAKAQAMRGGFDTAADGGPPEDADAQVLLAWSISDDLGELVPAIGSDALRLGGDA